MRITSKGQVTIPLAIREKAGLLPNTEGSTGGLAVGGARLFPTSSLRPVSAAVCPQPVKGRGLGSSDSPAEQPGFKNSGCSVLIVLGHERHHAKSCLAVSYVVL
jgi:hypothetical protein